MIGSLPLNLLALLSLVPALFVSLRQGGRRDLLYWGVLVLGAAGPLTLAAVRLSHGWTTGFSMALWLSIASSMAIFAVLSFVTREAWRLTPLLVPYLLLLGIGATMFSGAASTPMTAPLSMAWLDLHILVSVATYGLLTIAAIAGLAVFLQERALKRKRPTALSEMLPSVSDGEALQTRLLRASILVLSVGLISGAATQFLTHGSLLAFSHKVLFSLLAFATICGLLALHRLTGLRGRRAARILLLGYLFLTLAYPGVKFISDVLLA